MIYRPNFIVNDFMNADCIRPPIEADSGAELCEIYDPDELGGEPLSRYTSIPVTLAIVMAGAFVIVGIVVVLGVPIVDALIVYCFLAIPIGLAAIGSQIQRKDLIKPRAISLRQGHVTFSTSTEIETHPLTSCCWFRGRLKDDSQLIGHPFRGNSLVMILPSGRKVACGLTEPFTQQWLEKLEVYRCRQVLRQEGALGWLLSLLTIGSTIAGGCLGWALGRFLLSLVIPLPPQNPTMNLLPVALSVFCVWSGAIWQLYIPGWRRNTALEKQRYQRWAALLPIKFGIGFGFVATENMVASISVAAILALDFLGLTAAIIQPLALPVR